MLPGGVDAHFEVVPPAPAITGFSFLTYVDPHYISRDWSASLVSAVPEPKLYVLLAAGLGLLWLRRVRTA